MKRMALFLVLVIALPQIYPETPKKKKSVVQKFFNIFSPKPTPTPRKKRKAAKEQQPRREPTPGLIMPSTSPKERRSSSGAFVVDAQWIANYREQEFTFKNYVLPEDDNIEFINGQYHVPPVVYRHYEDMLNTARPDR